MRTKPESEKISIDLKNLKFDLTKPGKNSKFILVMVLFFYLLVIMAIVFALKEWALPFIGGAAFIPHIANPLKNLFSKKSGNSP